MKNKNVFFKAYIVTIMLFFSMPAFSQSIVYESNQLSEFSIIRNYKPGIDITFSDFYGTEVFFSYVNRSTMTTLSVDVSRQFHVEDFVILDDTVFFCGNINQTAICGYFDINDVFFGSGTITYFNLYVPTNTGESLLSMLSKIDVVRTSAGIVHMLMIGCYYTYDLIHLVPYFPSAIVDFWRDPSVGHKITFTIDMPYNYRYEDVAITKQYGVIAAATTSNMGAHSHNILYYKIPVAPGESFLDTWAAGGTSYTPIWTTDPTILDVDLYNLRITKMEEDAFATACINSHSGRLAVSVFNSPTIPPYTRFEIAPENSSFYLQDLTYNPMNKTLYFLENNNDNTFTLFNTTIPFNIYRKERSNLYRWLSIDNADSNNFEIISGFDMGNSYRIRFWLHDPNIKNENCFSYNTKEPKNLEIAEEQTVLEQILDNRYYSSQSIATKDKKYIIWKECH
ncbi:MAG: hypothetical protein IJ634_04185 [Bacteroidales bacterium]|nr:hypothetical protein [Bacteroidales bacterium]